MAGTMVVRKEAAKAAYSVGLKVLYLAVMKVATAVRMAGNLAGPWDAPQVALKAGQLVAMAETSAAKKATQKVETMGNRWDSTKVGHLAVRKGAYLVAHSVEL